MKIELCTNEGNIQTITILDYRIDDSLNLFFKTSDSVDAPTIGDFYVLPLSEVRLLFSPWDNKEKSYFTGCQHGNSGECFECYDIKKLKHDF